MLSSVTSLEAIETGPSAADRAPIVFLHEALGSVSHWGRFPSMLCEAAGRRGLVYSRQGHGSSQPLDEPRALDYLHQLAQEELPELLEARGIEAPVLFGHSDGATIALLHAAAFPEKVSALIVLAPHIFVEDVTLAGIREAVAPGVREALVDKLGRHHRDAEAVVAAWQDIWLAPHFRGWNIESEIAAIRCPVLLVQGEADAYGTLAQIDGIAAHVPHAQRLMLPDVGHSPHREAREAVIEASVSFLASLPV